ncbi:DsbA family protein [Actinomyces vulturis]|uniref:DsbA family protein n=1 Tax=Actinomyces vulturis TaxID=1857645 RepID=UPI0009F46CF1|nr:thioredoxin domain-containing protein [Actinomyces vulturis]
MSSSTSQKNSQESDAKKSAAESGNKRSSRTTVILLIVIAILLTIIAGMVATRPDGSHSTTGNAPQGDSMGNQAPANPEMGDKSGNQGNAQPAPDITDARGLEIIEQEIHRDPDDQRAQGKVDAPVVLVLYSDFACPYCTLFAQNVEPGLQDLIDNGTLRLEWRDLAQITPTSPLAAQAGIAASRQDAFWAFHNEVYGSADPQGHPTYSEESLVEFAKKAGVKDLDKFRTDMNDPAVVQEVQDAKAHAYSIGITGTPFMIINKAVIGGYMDLDAVRATVLDQAKKAEAQQ